MWAYTVAGCESAADYELAAATASIDADERDYHLNRASAFAHCCEQGRRADKAAAFSALGKHLCKPKFITATADARREELQETIAYALRLADEQGLPLVAAYIAQALFETKASNSNV